jgi:hypothetical protein
MATKGTLFIVDDEFTAKGAELERNRDYISGIIREYLAIVNFLCINLEGETARAIKELVDSMRSVPDDIIDASNACYSSAQQFVAEVDAADRFLY